MLALLCNTTELPEAERIVGGHSVLKFSQKPSACSRALPQIILFFQKGVKN